MSIATLKRKTKATARISGKQNGGFSLQGGHRNQGWVGQGSRGRSLGGTSFRGAVPRGAGGTNGLYPRIINNKGSCCSNDSSVVKRTTMTYQNYIDSIVPDRLHDECVCPAKIWVKDFSPLNHSQGARINRIAREEGAWGAKEVHEMDAGYDSCSPNCGSASYHIGGKKYVREMYAKKLNYLEDGGEMYQRTGLMQKKNLPPPAPCKVIQ
jgi:hypothetical protein